MDFNTDKRRSLIYTLAIQVFLFLILYFSVAWRTPNPPIPEYGIEIGLVDVPSLSSPPKTENITEEEQESAKVSETEEEQDISSTLLEDVEEQTQQEIITTTENEQPAVEKVENKISTPEQSKIENQNIKPAQSESDNKEQKESSPVTHDTKQIDDRALYGSNQTSSEGASLDMIGWTWDELPKPNDPTEETGTIIYEILIDEEGYVVSIKILTSTVSPQTERYYRKSIEGLTFSKTSGYKSSNESKGKITFRINRKK